jgi:GntR family transcriptional regulator/MocR family aminotransferase
VPDHQTNFADWSGLTPILPPDGPRARALYTALRGLIEAGTLPPGAKLPPTRDLAARFAVSRGAAVAAYEQLLAEGFAQARVGAGTYVAALVPRLGPAPATPSLPEMPRYDLPGAIGTAFDDDRTRRQLRACLNRHLLPPNGAHLRYADPRGSADLRAEVASYLRTARGVRCTADQIILTGGTQQALDLILRAVLSPGDAVWFEDPGYPSARVALEGAGMRMVPVRVDEQGLDVAAGIAAAPSAKAAYVTPSHQYPMGVVMTMPRRLALLGWAKVTGAWIIEDDYDSEFRYAGAPLTALQGLDDAGRVIYIGTFAKALFPGLRLGYLVLPPDLLARVVQARARIDRSPPALAEGALAEFLRDGHFAAHLRRNRRRAEASRDAMVQALGAVGLTVASPEQGLHLIAPLPPGTEDRALIAPLAEKGLAARPLSALYLGGKAQSGLVMGFSGFSPEAIRRAITCAAPVLTLPRTAA